MNAPEVVSLEGALGIERKKDEKDGPICVKAATHFLKRGNTFSPVDASSLVVTDTLPLGTYTVGASPAGFYFERIDDFELPQKIYGDTMRHAARILATFMDRPNATGALLEGEKGSGKSLLLKQLSIEARKLGMPTIVINSAFCGDAFNTFIQNLKQPAVIAFDEFEKVYDSDDQERLLTILDGTFPSKKLFVLTVNNKYRIDAHMRNRPGRIFYSLSFGGLDNGFITEYCQDNLKNASHITGVLAVAGHFGKFTFDMLKALVEEMNRYDEPAADAMKWLNINPEEGGTSCYSIEVLKDGQPLSADWRLTQDYYNGNPLTVDDWTFYANRNEVMPDGREKRMEAIQFDLDEKNIASYDPTAGSYRFTFPDRLGYVAVLTRYTPAARTYAYY